MMLHTAQETPEILAEVGQDVERETGYKVWQLVLALGTENGQLRIDRVRPADLLAWLKGHPGVVFATVAQGKDLVGYLNDVGGVVEHREEYLKLLDFAVKSWKEDWEK